MQLQLLNLLHSFKVATGAL